MASLIYIYTCEEKRTGKSEGKVLENGSHMACQLEIGLLPDL